jgi:hypothetical protein
VWYVPSLRYTRGLGCCMHCNTEVTESSTNKQHHFSRAAVGFAINSTTSSSRAPIPKTSLPTPKCQCQLPRQYASPTSPSLICRVREYVYVWSPVYIWVVDAARVHVQAAYTGTRARHRLRLFSRLRCTIQNWVTVSGYTIMISSAESTRASAGRLS